MWWERVDDPISGVANCHVKGLYSLAFNEDLRAFITTDWTSLSGNFYGEAVGFHDHHRALDIKVAVGQILNISPQMNRGERCPMKYHSWRWDSKLRGGKGSFTLLDDGRFIGNGFTCKTLDPSIPPLHLGRDAVHTVKQLTKWTMWFVRESGPSTGKATTTWSTRDLTSWHNQPDMYREMSPAGVAELWELMRGLK